MSAPPTPQPQSLLEVLRGAVRTTPRQLWAAGAVIGLAAFVFFLAVELGTNALTKGVQKVGRETAPSIIAAQRIRAHLAGLHGSALKELLADPGPVRSAAAARYDTRRQELTAELLTAAKKVTYSSAEEVPLRELVTALGTYEAAIAQARALRDRDPAACLNRIRDADRILHEQPLRAAADLDRANRSELDHEYAQARWQSVWAILAVVGVGGALIAVLVVTQLYVRRRTRRQINPGLLAATVLAAAFLIASVVAFYSERRRLGVAVKEAFDSVHMLEDARAEANDARAAQRLRLRDPERADAQHKQFRERASRLVELKDGLTTEKLLDAVGRGRVPSGFEGLLAKELDNITFDGEREAAAAALFRFIDYLKADQRVRALEEANKGNEARALCLSTGADGPDAAFERFDAALGAVLEINHREFKSAIVSGEAVLKPFKWLSPVAAIGVALLAFAGLRPRIKEYSP
jgi:hypothetical protein